MKKGLFMTLMLLAVSLTALGQDDDGAKKAEYKKGFSYGVRAGLNVANFTTGDTDAILRSHIGLVVSYRFGEFFGVGAELLYSGAGGSMNITIPDEGKSDDAHLNVNFVSLPLLAKFYLMDGLSIQAGVQADFITNNRINYRGDKMSSPLKTNPVALAVPMALSYELYNGINITARYNMGMTDIFYSNSYEDIRSSQLLISVGYMF